MEVADQRGGGCGPAGDGQGRPGDLEDDVPDRGECFPEHAKGGGWEQAGWVS